MYHNYEIGLLGEKISKEYLNKNNYIVIDKNFRVKHGEIDLISIDKNTNELVFLEVKTRTNFKYGRGIEAINYRKVNRIKNAARIYIYINKYENRNIRFDAIELYIINNKFKINHIKNAF